MVDGVAVFEAVGSAEGDCCVVAGGLYVNKDDVLLWAMNVSPVSCCVGVGASAG